MNKIIVVIAAHPDDEVIGCGGTIAKHIEDKDEVHVLIMSKGVLSRHMVNSDTNSINEVETNIENAHKANHILGCNSVKIENFPDNRMDSVDRLDIVKCIEEFLEDKKPEIIYTHNCNDLKIDHRRIHEVVVTACRPQPGQINKTLLFFEVSSSTEWQSPNNGPGFIPNWHVDITSTLEKKKQALEIYDSEMRDWPHARSIKSIEHLAHYRGASIGVEAAESFILGKNIK